MVFPPTIRQHWKFKQHIFENSLHMEILLHKWNQCWWEYIFGWLSSHSIQTQLKQKCLLLWSGSLHSMAPLVLVEISVLHISPYKGWFQHKKDIFKVPKMKSLNLSEQSMHRGRSRFFFQFIAYSLNVWWFLGDFFTPSSKSQDLAQGMPRKSLIDA